MNFNLNDLRTKVPGSGVDVPPYIELETIVAGM
jgi:hypothetical protein